MTIGICIKKTVISYINFFFVILGICYYVKICSYQSVSLRDVLSSSVTLDVLRYDTMLSIKNTVKRVVICSPIVVTGGPENLCQIYDALYKQGFDVYMLWINDENSIYKQYRDGVWYLCGSSIDRTPDIYASLYHIKFLDYDIILDDETLIIIPEIWCDYLFFFQPAKVALCWLSWINVYAVGRSKICEQLIQQKKLNCLPCVHIAQAPWICKKILQCGSESLLVGDYISHIYCQLPVQSEKKNCIAYNPTKGAILAELFFKKHISCDVIPLRNFNQIDMIKALDASKIYIDFGHFPGKDRIPREALLRRCIIFIHNDGCAVDYDSFPIDDYFKFDQSDIMNGALHAKIEYCLQEYETMLVRQSYFRECILSEYDEFEKNIINIFGCCTKN